MRTPCAYRLAASHVSDRRTRPPLPSASWVSDARSALVPFRRLAALAGCALIAAVLTAGPIGKLVPAGAQSLPGGVVTLTSQDVWVQRSNVPVRLGLKVRSSTPAKDLVVSVALYTEPDQSSLASRDEFEATLAGQLAGLNQLTPTKFSLQTISKSHGAVKIYVGGAELAGRVPRRLGPDEAAFQLPCPAHYGGCGGVYPLEVSLDDVLTGQPVDSFTTYLIVVPSAISFGARLRFSFVVPVGTSLALTAGGSPALPASTLAEMDTIADAEARWSKLPLTEYLYGQALLALARSPRHARLESTVSYAGLDTLVAGPFSAVDPTRLVRSGLMTDLTSQINRGDAVFTKVFHSAARPDLYVATTPIGTRALAALADRRHQVRRRPPGRSRVSHRRSTRHGAVALHPLGALCRRGDQGGRPASRPRPRVPSHRCRRARAEGRTASRRLGRDLFRLARLPSPRGVVPSSPPESWLPKLAFLGAMLRGLRSSPIVTTVPIGELFASVPPAAARLHRHR